MGLFQPDGRYRRGDRKADLIHRFTDTAALARIAGELSTIAAVREIGPETSARLVARHGTEAPAVVALAAELDLLRPLHASGPSSRRRSRGRPARSLPSPSTTSWPVEPGWPRSCPIAAKSIAARVAEHPRRRARLGRIRAGRWRSRTTSLRPVASSSVAPPGPPRGAHGDARPLRLTESQGYASLSESRTIPPETPRNRPWPERSSTQLGLLSRLTREPDGIASATERSFRFRVQRQEPDLRGLRTGVRVHRVRAGLLRAAWLHRASPLPVLSRQPQGCPQQLRAAAARTSAATAPAAATRPAAPAATAAAVAATALAIAVRARCSPRPARPAARRPRSRSARPAASPSTAATASAASAAADLVLSVRADSRPAEPA